MLTSAGWPLESAINVHFYIWINLNLNEIFVFVYLFEVHCQTLSHPPNWSVISWRVPLFSFLATDGLSPQNCILPLHIPTGIRWKAYQWTIHLDLKWLGSHCKGCSCTKNQQNVIQCNVKEATSQEFHIWNFRTKILARLSHIWWI